jgi:hypothetical protein
MPASIRHTAVLNFIGEKIGNKHLACSISKVQPINTVAPISIVNAATNLIELELVKSFILKISATPQLI